MTAFEPKNMYYAIIALNEEEVNDVIHTLKAMEGMEKLANWLENNKDNIYGALPEEWKPFGDKSISDLLSKVTKSYICETKLICSINDECSNAEILDGIDVYFIDIFTLFSKKYHLMAKILDYGFADAAKGKCCFLINYKLPSDLQEQLANECEKTWNYVLKGYIQGSLHRVAARINDMYNFAKYIQIYQEEHVNPGAKKAMRSDERTKEIIDYGSHPAPKF